MRLLLLLPLLVSTTVQGADSGTCIIAAAERLPRVAGLAIQNSTVRELTAAEAARWHQNPSSPMFVDIAVQAAGQEATYTYLCGETKFGLFVRPLPDGKLPR